MTRIVSPSVSVTSLDPEGLTLADYRRGPPEPWPPKVPPALPAPSLFTAPVDEPPWQTLAACTGVDPALFFPSRGESIREARQVCNRCPVREECLEAALERGEKFGVWGGKSERERRRLRKARGAAA